MEKQEILSKILLYCWSNKYIHVCRSSDGTSNEQMGPSLVLYRWPGQTTLGKFKPYFWDSGNWNINICNESHQKFLFRKLNKNFGLSWSQGKVLHIEEWICIKCSTTTFDWTITIKFGNMMQIVTARNLWHLNNCLSVSSLDACFKLPSAACSDTNRGIIDTQNIEIWYWKGALPMIRDLFAFHFSENVVLCECGFWGPKANFFCTAFQRWA